MGHSTHPEMPFKELIEQNLIKPEDPEKYAVTQRFWFEQAKRTQDILEELSKQYGVSVPDGCHSVLGYMDYVDYGHDQRRRNAT